MKVQRVKIAEYQYVWLVLDDNFFPVQPIEVFIRYLHHTEKSPDTIQSYATHLKLFWEYLQETQRNWQIISIADFAEFVHWLRSQTHNVFCLKNSSNSRRTERTVNTILSALASFYRYHNQLGNTDIKWLYNQPELNTEISLIRSKNGAIQRVIDQQFKLHDRENTISILKNKNKQLKATIRKLRYQLEVVYGEIYKLKQNNKG